MKILKGQLIAVTCGAYAEYCLNGHVRALRDFDPAEEVASFKLAPGYLKTYPDGFTTTLDAEYRFLDWLCANEVVEVVKGIPVLHLERDLADGLISDVFE